MEAATTSKILFYSLEMLLLAQHMVPKGHSGFLLLDQFAGALLWLDWCSQHPWPPSSDGP
jgi:hypothetical protein